MEPALASTRPNTSDPIMESLHPLDCSGKIDKLKTAIFFVLSLPCQALKKTYQFTISSFSKIFHYFEAKESVYKQQVRQANEFQTKIISNNFENLDNGLAEIATLTDYLAHKVHSGLIKHCLENNHVDYMGELLEKIDAQSFYSDVCENFQSTDMFVLLHKRNLTHNYLLEKAILHLDLTQDADRLLFDDFLTNFKNVTTWEHIAQRLLSENAIQREEKISAIFSKQWFNAVTVEGFMMIHLDSRRFQKDRDGPLIEILINSMPEEHWPDEQNPSLGLNAFIEELERFKKESAHPEIWEKFIEAVQAKCSESNMIKSAAKTH